MTTRTKTSTAGAKLRAELDRALLRAADELGVAALEFSELERALIDSAADQADWVCTLKKLRDAELAGDAAPTTLTKYSAEIRLCERQQHDLIARVNLGLGVAKSEQHQRAARARWNRGSAVAKHGA